MTERPDLARRVTRTATRAIAIILAAAVVGGVLSFWIGPPEAAREYRQDELARFAPTFGHGLSQFAGETFLLALVAYVSRRWFKVRL